MEEINIEKEDKPLVYKMMLSNQWSGEEDEILSGREAEAFGLNRYEDTTPSVDVVIHENF